MFLEIPDSLLEKSKLTEQELRVEFALFLYKKKVMTLEQAIKFSELDGLEFQKLLTKKRIPVNYTEEDFEDDLKTIKKMFG